MKFIPLLENRRTHLDVTNFITGGLTGGKTSKKDNVLMWNRMHPPPPDFAVGGLRVEIRLGVYEGIQKGENLGIKDTPFMYFALFWHTLQQAERTIDLSLLFH